MLQLMLLIATKTASFSYPTTSLELGISHIHSPEQIAQTHPFTIPYFKVLPFPTKPVVSKGCALVSFDFQVGVVPGYFTARMFTARPLQSCIFVMDQEHRPCFWAKLTVEPLGANGHTLHVDTTSYMHVNCIARLFAPVWRHFLWWEFESLGGRFRAATNPNLRAYRKLVMQSNGVMK
jgi:hypothetical protein